MSETTEESAFMVGESNSSTHASLVDAMTIDDIMNANNLDTIDILKLDKEGAEKEVFEIGFENWLPKVRCLIIELHDNIKPGTSKAFFSAINQYDFTFDSIGENLIFFNNSYK